MLSNPDQRLTWIVVSIAAAVFMATLLIWPAAWAPVLIATAVLVISALLIAQRYTRALERVGQAVRRFGEQSDASEKIASGGVSQLGSVVGSLLSQQHQQLTVTSQQATQLSTILEGMAEGVIAVDTNETVLRINGAARRMLEP